MGLVNFSNLDFNQVKTSLKEYLRANSTFTDYDFEGSNLSSIIDVLIVYDIIGADVPAQELQFALQSTR